MTELSFALAGRMVGCGCKRSAFLVLTLALAVLVGPAAGTAWADRDSDELNRLNSLVYDLGGQQRMQEARAAAQQLEQFLGGYESRHSKDRSIIVPLYNLGSFYEKVGEYAKAVVFYQRGLAASESHLGPGDKLTAQYLSSLGTMYMYLVEYDKAEPLLKRALEVRERVFGPEKPETARSVNNLATLYMSREEYAKAEPLLKRAIDISEKLFGPEHPETATSVHNLGLLYFIQNDYSKAEPLLTRNRAIVEKAYGQNHPKMALALVSLGELNFRLLNLDLAETQLRRSLAIGEATLGPHHPDTTQAMEKLAYLLMRREDFAQAEALLKRSLAIKEKTYGPDSPQLAGVLSSLSSIYGAIGDAAQGESLLRRSLASTIRAFGPEHHKSAGMVSSLAEWYLGQGQHAQAEVLFKQSLRMIEKALGPEHPATAEALYGLGRAYQEQYQYAEAEPLFKRALTIREKALGPDHPLTAQSRAGLVSLALFRGDFVKAEQALPRILKTLESTLGKRHQTVASTLEAMASLAELRGDYKRAQGLFQSAQEMTDQHIDQVMSFTSEGQKLAFLAKCETGLADYLAMVGQKTPNDALAVRGALDAWLRRKGLVLDSQKQVWQALLASTDPKVTRLGVELTQIRQQLSSLAFSGEKQADGKPQQSTIAGLEARKNSLEAELSGLSQTFAAHRKTVRANSAAVAKALPKGAALVEFARISPLDYKALGDKDRRKAPPRYLAFVLPSGTGASPQVVDLGEAKGIENQVATLHAGVKNYAADPNGLAAAKAASQLHDKIFAPLRKHLGPVRDIFLSPDGSLNLLAFEILRGPTGRYLVEDYTFTYLNSGRDLLGFGGNEAPKGKALLLGDPDFDLGQEGRAQILRGLGLSSAAHRPAAPGALLRSRGMGGLSFGRLPETKKEIEAIGGLLGAGNSEFFMGGGAQEEVLMSRQAPKIIHLATHGFFFSQQELTDTLADPLGLGPKRSDSGFAVVENPLLRSGILLAGGNVSLKSSGSEENSGIVTAEKILSLNLRGTDLVVLSACDTGTGEVKSGQGVYGLRRAFSVAGARGVVMSMWSVPDLETRELMVEFYKNLLGGTMDRSQALRQAMLREMAEVRKRYGTAHPLFWGAFVFAGER